MADRTTAAGALYKAPAAGAVSVTSTLSFFAQAAETTPNNPSVTRIRVTEAFAPIDPPPEGLRKLDSNAYARRSSGHLCGFGQKVKPNPPARLRLAAPLVRGANQSNRSSLKRR